MTVAKRLREARGFYDENQKEMAARLGAPYRTYQGWENGVAPPSLDVLNRLVELGFNADWLLAGTGPMRRPEEDASFQAVVVREAPGLVSIPFYEDTRAAAGGGALANGDAPRFIAMEEAYLSRAFGVGARELAVMPADGESMEPTIRAGELMLFDRSEHGCRLRDGIFIVRLEGALVVKRLQPLPGQVVEVKSDNPAYTPYTLRLDPGTDFAILGRVVVIFRRL